MDCGDKFEDNSSFICCQFGFCPACGSALLECCATNICIINHTQRPSWITRKGARKCDGPDWFCPFNLRGLLRACSLAITVIALATLLLDFFITRCDANAAGCIIIKCVWRNFDEISAMMVVSLRCWNVANWFLSSSSDNDTASVEMRERRDKDHVEALKKCHPTMGLSPESFHRLSPNHPNFPWNKRAARTPNNKILTLKMRQAASREENESNKELED